MRSCLERTTRDGPCRGVARHHGAGEGGGCVLQIIGDRSLQRLLERGYRISALGQARRHRLSDARHRVTATPPRAPLTVSKARQAAGDVATDERRDDGIMPGQAATTAPLLPPTGWRCTIATWTPTAQPRSPARKFSEQRFHLSTGVDRRARRPDRPLHLLSSTLMRKQSRTADSDQSSVRFGCTAIEPGKVTIRVSLHEPTFR